MEIGEACGAKRHQAGKGVARRLRRAGQLPAVVYGNGTTVAIALAEKDLTHIQQSEAGENTILDFVIEGDTPESCQPSCARCRYTPSVARRCMRIFIVWICANRSR